VKNLLKPNGVRNMRKTNLVRIEKVLLMFLIAVFLACTRQPAPERPASQAKYHRSYTVVEPGTHPGLLFSAEELPALRKRAAGGGLAGEAYRKLVERAHAEVKDSRKAANEMVAKALVYQIEGDRELGRQAVTLLKDVITRIDPFEYHEKVIDSDFFKTEHWPIAFAYTWDWTYELMNDEERSFILHGIENWCKALFEHTESWWWREASYNCGAIPVGALGFACAAIQGETKHPEFEKWYSSAIRRIQRNYFPTAWRENGICYEGPCYAHYHKNPTRLGEALRRTGGPDILKNSGAINAMQYQMFQWMPQGGCGPIGDNTGYGRRVFEAGYLLGIGETADRAGLWTFERYTDRRRLDPVITFLWYPEGLEPQSPLEAGYPTSRYFEITRNRAGYIYSRSAWDDERAAWFAFVTRYENCNHQHYDMNTFLFCAFGEEFATHRNIYPYHHPHHGVDFEHNIVIVDEGGMPAHDRQNSAGDDCSLYGLLVGLGLGHFADYVRGDAKDSYQDRSDPATLPAERADRSCLFVKQGPNPYLVVVDDIQKSGREHDYHWHWYTLEKSIEGSGTLQDPLLIKGENANCSIAFLHPGEPDFNFQIVRSPNPRRKLELGLIRVNQRGIRVRYIAVAAAWEKDKRAPIFKKGPLVEGNPAAASLLIETDTYRDLILWQPEEYKDNIGARLSCGGIVTDGLLSMVRTDPEGQVVGYVLGEGKQLYYNDRVLVDAEDPVCVSADNKRLYVTGKRRARENLPPLKAKARVWVPHPEVELYADGELVKPLKQPGGIALVGK